MRLLFISTSLLMLLLFTESVNARQNPVQDVLIKGVVIDAVTEETIPYATIRVSDKDKPDVVTKIIPADENGNFRFSVNRKGNYILKVEFVGKTTVTKEFEVNNAQILDLGNISMKDNASLLKEVVVSAQKKLVKVDHDKIIYSIESDPEAKTNNVLDMLKKVPMITVDGEDNIQLKGSSDYKIYMNGKPSGLISANPKDILKSMPANTVKDIEIITEPGAKYDAEGLAGIINIITLKQSSMAGYTASINTNIDTQGGYRLGGNLMFKAGKVGFMGNYNYYRFKSPDGSYKMIRESFNDDIYKHLNNRGDSELDANGQYGSGELSYEIDTLNLINIGYSRYQGSSKNKSFFNSLLQNSNLETVQEYNAKTNSKNTWGNTGFNLDYQRSSKTVKDRLLTLSYKFTLSPNDWSSKSTIENIYEYDVPANHQFSDGDMKEHTFQLDFTTPFAKIHTLEAGAKYIIRLNESNSRKDFMNETGNWVEFPGINDKFKHEQDILALYFGYSVKYKKISLKTGLRYEGTDFKAKYPLGSENNFSGDYSNLVPSITLAYQLKPMQNIRLAYNMRIMRPGISQLNPFSNTTDSMNISVGNPDLDAVKSHSLSLNYSLFNPKFNLNANLSYNFLNNNIDRVSYYENGIIRTTYENIGKNKGINLFAFFSWTPSSKLRITSNMLGSYIDIRTNNEYNQRNSGFSGRFHTDIAYTFPEKNNLFSKVRINSYGGYSFPYITLQGENGAYSYYGFSLAKDFMNDKLNIRLSASSPFTKNRTFSSRQKTPDFYMRTESVMEMRQFSISVSFKFGEMKAQVKKAKRGISNDDSMGGATGGAVGVQGQQGGM